MTEKNFIKERIEDIDLKFVCQLFQCSQFFIVAAVGYIGAGIYHLEGIDGHQRGIRMLPDEVGDLSHQPLCR